MNSAPKSPLFPDTSLTLNSGPNAEPSYTPLLPDTPTIQTSSLQVFIVPTEKHLFVQGFKPSEYEQRPPTLLRGCLVVRVLKPSKLKSISLSFRGIQKTDWPEGIPPKRYLYAEVNDLVNHSWPFYNSENPVPNLGADMYISSCKSRLDEGLALESQISPLAVSQPDSTAPSSFVSSLVRKAASSLVVPSPSSALTPVSSFHDLTAVLSGSSQTDLSKASCATPGDYVYNFEHPIPASSPESTHVNFGVVHYYLEVAVSRQTTFKSNLSGRLPIKVVRIPSDNSVEENEPIVIERDWEDQLRYEIVIGSKSVVLDTFLPLSLKFIPLYGKVALHRIRVYITEDCHYYCHNKSVHRTEPSRKYLLLEHKANKNMSLLSKNGGQGEADPDDEVLPRELEFQMYVPSVVNRKHTYSIHPDTAVENIQCTHWIKISLRISRQDLDNPGKRKHFEISIDSPIHLHSPLAAHNLTLLPKYNTEPEFLPQYSQTPIGSPGVTAVDASKDGNHLLSVFESGTDAGPSRSSTPIEFQHINSASNNDNPIERDDAIHLESNLYKPEDNSVLDAIGSPQATAYIPVVSPMASPLRGAPQPSRDPPAFDALCVQDTSDTLPPAYERDHSSLSLSPLRLDCSPVQSVVEGYGIKDKLFRQLDKFESNSSDTRSTKSGTSKSSSNSKTSRNSRVSDKKLNSFAECDSPKGKEGTSRDAMADKQPKESDDRDKESKESGDTDKESMESKDTVETDKESKDGLSEHSLNGRKSTDTEWSRSSRPSLNHSRRHLGSSLPQPNSLGKEFRPRTSSVSSSRSSTSQRSFEEKYSADLADFGGLNEHNNFSRTSSVTSSVFQSSLDENMPLEQTIPLLTFSNASIDEEGLSVGRSAITDSMTDLVPTTLDGFGIRNSLRNIDNPRLTKHYQDNRREDELHDISRKTRQKSFGVVPDIPSESVSGPNSDDSGSTIDEYSKDVGFVPNHIQQVLSR